MSVIYYFAIILFLVICALLCFVILMQESKTTGLGTSFGGDAGESLFGTGTADVLKKFTAWLAVIFIGGCVLLSFWTAAIGNTRGGVSQAASVIENEVAGGE